MPRSKVKGVGTALLDRPVSAAHPEKQAAKLLDRIAVDPVLIARMLNRDLDPTVLNLAETLGIDIFPSRWTNLDMDCSCPNLGGALQASSGGDLSA